MCQNIQDSLPAQHDRGIDDYDSNVCLRAFAFERQSKRKHKQLPRTSFVYHQHAMRDSERPAV